MVSVVVPRRIGAYCTTVPSRLAQKREGGDVMAT